MLRFIHHVLNVSLAFSFVQKCVHKYNDGFGSTKLNGCNTAEWDYELCCPDSQGVGYILRFRI